MSVQDEKGYCKREGLLPEKASWRKSNSEEFKQEYSCSWVGEIPKIKKSICVMCKSEITKESNSNFWNHPSGTITDHIAQPDLQFMTYQPTMKTIDEQLIDDALRVCFCLLDYIEEEIDRIPENGYTSKLLRQTMLLEKKLAEETQRKLKKLLK